MIVCEATNTNEDVTFEALCVGLWRVAFLADATLLFSSHYDQMPDVVIPHDVATWNSSANVDRLRCPMSRRVLQNATHQFSPEGNLTLGSSCTSMQSPCILNAHIENPREQWPPPLFASDWYSAMVYMLIHPVRSSHCFIVAFDYSRAGELNGSLLSSRITTHLVNRQIPKTVDARVTVALSFQQVTMIFPSSVIAVSQYPRSTFLKSSTFLIGGCPGMRFGRIVPVTS